MSPMRYLVDSSRAAMRGDGLSRRRVIGGALAASAALGSHAAGAAAQDATPAATQSASTLETVSGQALYSFADVGGISA